MARKANPEPRVSLKDIPPPASAMGVMNRKQVCQGLGGISIRQLSTLIARGSFPRPDFKVGESPRWSVAMFNAWVEANRIKPMD
jgi:predicted DNA-binding transcriptional regulator AlpA